MNQSDQDMKAKLIEMYWEKEMSYRDISTKLQVPYTWVKNKFEELMIRTRTRKKANKLKWRQKLHGV